MEPLVDTTLDYKDVLEMGTVKEPRGIIKEHKLL